VYKPQVSGYPEDFALDRHSGVAVGSKVYYFGGLLKGVKINDVYCVDTEKLTFELVQCWVNWGCFGGLICRGKNQFPERIIRWC
jgi:hypothetical protein